MRKLFEESKTEDLTAVCVKRRIKTMKTVHSQKVNKILMSHESGAGTDALRKLHSQGI
jgi:hypothetical protein